MMYEAALWVGAVSLSFFCGYMFARARAGRQELPLVRQAWKLKGRGVVVVTAVHPKQDKVTFILENNKGTWDAEDAVTTSLSRIKDDPEPDPLEPIEPELPPEPEPESP